MNVSQSIFQSLSSSLGISPNMIGILMSVSAILMVSIFVYTITRNLFISIMASLLVCIAMSFIGWIPMWASIIYTPFVIMIGLRLMYVRSGNRSVKSKRVAIKPININMSRADE